MLMPAFFCAVLVLFADCTMKRKQEYDGVKSAVSYADILEQNPNGVLATRNGEQMRTQIMSFQFVEGNRIYFCTGSEKPLYEQLRRFPQVSYCTWPEDFEPVVSMNGKVVFTDDTVLKERVFSGTGYASDFIRRHYKSTDNPNLKLFYIEVEEIETYSSDGPKIYKAQ
jgi:uncharacterized pyridoxamine 5'-phosphate oxidase family protein